MSHRELTSDETAVLAHVVVDPDEWWVHCEENFKGDQEKALAVKIARCKPDYDAAVAAGNYKNRAERDAENSGPPI
mgnify:CR=1 FL=1